MVITLSVGGTKDENGNKIDEGTIGKQIEQYFQQIVYSVNQPAAARGFQSAFWNVSYFDRPYLRECMDTLYSQMEILQNGIL